MLEKIKYIHAMFPGINRIGIWLLPNITVIIQNSSSKNEENHLLLLDYLNGLRSILLEMPGVTSMTDYAFQYFINGTGHNCNKEDINSRNFN